MSLKLYIYTHTRERARVCVCYKWTKYHISSRSPMLKI